MDSKDSSYFPPPQPPSTIGEKLLTVLVYIIISLLSFGFLVVLLAFILTFSKKLQWLSNRWISTNTLLSWFDFLQIQDQEVETTYESIRRNELQPPSYHFSMDSVTEEIEWNLSQPSYSVPELLLYGGYVDYKGKFKKAYVKNLVTGDKVIAKDLPTMIDQARLCPYTCEYTDLFGINLIFNDVYIDTPIGVKDQLLKFYRFSSRRKVCRYLKTLDVKYILPPDREFAPDYELV
ncbi:hypothetical protein CANARDRAFT_29313 [[Candida] arabinofermentans NRRL YB-2248]|uniref:Uncharacterized protein n=1 Tax=[Candida] arabinofermentans NRRL YB-2248 TaxID=983967 RepID=A0A1E4SXB8_9ASCO|nr:hypothetical protein CANARDRAFT_29313 [[Candida] arabinofermentans NRRL YB-2248]